MQQESTRQNPHVATSQMKPCPPHIALQQPPVDALDAGTTFLMQSWTQKFDARSARQQRMSAASFPAPLLTTKTLRTRSTKFQAPFVRQHADRNPCSCSAPEYTVTSFLRHVTKLYHLAMQGKLAWLPAHALHVQRMQYTCTRNRMPLHRRHKQLKCHAGCEPLPKVCWPVLRPHWCPGLVA